MINFKVQIGDEKEVRNLNLETGLYHLAAAAVPAIFDLEPPLTVKIWVNLLLPDYGPYYYQITYNEYQNLIIKPVFLTND